MAHADFVHLRVHTAFSLSEGAIKLDELVALCRAHRMPAVAMTDSGNLFGAMQFSEVCCDAGVQPIIGCVLPLARDGEAARDGPSPALDEIVVLAQNDAGYGNLVKLVSRAFMNEESGAVLTWADLGRHAEGLIAVTGGPGGPVGRLLGEGPPRAASPSRASGSTQPMIGCTPASQHTSENFIAPNRLPESVIATAGMRWAWHNATSSSSLIAPSESEKAV